MRASWRWHPPQKKARTDPRQDCDEPAQRVTLVDRLERVSQA
jgi:hypothetical protein